MIFTNSKIASDKDKPIISDSGRALITIGMSVFIGLLAIIIYALQASSFTQYVSYATIGLMVSGASLLIGGLLGFLFGIPRTLQNDRSFELVSKNEIPSPDKEDPNINYRANTNLEQISDWLTKILVGVGLTQITVIPDKLLRIAKRVSTGLGNSDGSQIFALAIILFFIICGFLFGYLWTRLFLPGAFRQADLSILVNRVEKASIEVKQVNEKLEEMEKQTKYDAAALNLAQRQLNPSIDIPAVTQEQLNDAIKYASRPVRIQIFNQAENIRRDNWRSDKTKMGLTVPIFKALIESDIQDQFHRNHAQLGFALKDQQKPEWSKAEAELTRAIEIRDSLKENGWLIYEFNRAICRINQDDGFLNGKASTTENKDKILSDLRAAAKSELKKRIQNDISIEKWMTLNQITSKDLN